MEGDEKIKLLGAHFHKAKLETYQLKDQLPLKAFHSFQLDSLSGICSDLCHFSAHGEYKAC